MSKSFQRLLLAILCLLSFVSAPAYAKRYAAEQRNLDINMLGVYALPRQGLTGAAGVGGTLYGDIRLMPFLAIGLNLGATSYFSDPGRHAMFAEVAGRLFPFGATPKGEMYLQGGVGIFMPSVNGIDDVGRRVCGNAAIGYRKWLKGNKYVNMALNLDMFSPRNRPMGSLGLKVGYGMRFGRMHTPGRGRRVTPEQAAAMGYGQPTPVTEIVIQQALMVPTAVPPTPTPVVVKKVIIIQQPKPAAPAPARPGFVPVKPAAAKPAAAKPAVAALAKPKPAAPAAAKPAVAALAKPAVSAAAKAVVTPAKAATKTANGMMEMNFGAPAVKAGVAAAKAGTPGVGAAKSVNIDLGGAKNVAGAAKAVPAPIPYKWVAGDTLTALAEAFYGDQGLYPILVDANEAKLVLPENLKAGVIISIPRGVDDVTKAKAREKAIQPHYVQWKAAGK